MRWRRRDSGGSADARLIPSPVRIPIQETGTSHARERQQTRSRAWAQGRSPSHDSRISGTEAKRWLMPAGTASEKRGVAAESRGMYALGRVVVNEKTDERATWVAMGGSRHLWAITSSSSDEDDEEDNDWTSVSADHQDDDRDQGSRCEHRCVAHM